jgi:hypothetical protein
MITVEMVYGLALARYGVVRAPQLAAVYESLPDADRQVAERVEAMPMPAAMVAARTLLADAETGWERDRRTCCGSTPTIRAAGWGCSWWPSPLSWRAATRAG